MDISPSAEAEMGVNSYREVMGQYESRVLREKDPRVAYVKGVARRIVEANGLGGKGWECFVVEDDTMNA